MDKGRIGAFADVSRDRAVQGPPVRQEEVKRLRRNKLGCMGGVLLTVTAAELATAGIISMNSRNSHVAVGIVMFTFLTSGPAYLGLVLTALNER